MNSSTTRNLLLLATIILNTGCSVMGAARTGQVLNLETKEPIERAVVVVLWRGVSGIYDATNICYHIMTDTSNENGRYATGFWFGFDAPIWSTDVMEVGYREGFIRPKRSPHDNNVYLIPFHGTREERFAYLERLLSATTCADAGVSYKNLYRIRKAIYEEAMKLAISKEEKELAEGFGYSAASVIADELIDPRRPQEEQDKVVEKILRDNP